MFRTIITAAAAAGVALLVSGCGAGPAPRLACPSEDYSGPTACHWDASKQGNGAGVSFTWTGSKVIYATTR